MLPEEANDITRNPSAANMHRAVHSMRQTKLGDVPANDYHRKFGDAGDANRCDESSNDI